MSKKMKNIAQSEVLTLREQISYQEGQVVSKTLTQNQAVSITLFSFAKGEEISTHESGGDAFVTCLDGIGKITIDGVEYLLHEGESIVMPAGHPHALNFIIRCAKAISVLSTLATCPNGASVVNSISPICGIPRCIISS